MSDARVRFTTDPIILRAESGKLIVANNVASKIQNFVSTSEGTLQSVIGPAPLVPKDSEGDFPTAYGTMYGIYHTTLRGGAVDMTLLHSGRNIWHYQGWSDPDNPWVNIVGATGGLVTLIMGEPETPQFPTQFETTPRGVVIVPQNEMRAVYYDGETALTLGYDTAPPAPIGYGPETEVSAEPNRIGYKIDRVASGYTLHQDFGYGRLGTVREATSAEARLLTGSYQAAVQWIDYFGNLSPISSRSNEIVFLEQEVGSTGKPGDQVRKQVLWGTIAPGPEGTIGRVLSRTKDTKNSGTQKLFIVPGNVGEGTLGAFATLPDNVAQTWPDNVPDSWIVSEPHDAMAVPVFKLCRLALGRLWIANTLDDPGILIPSIPGRYGTFKTNSEIFPDPSGGEITGLWSTMGGLLVFTATSTFMLEPSNDGKDFRLVTLNANVGCVAPSSISNFHDGSTIWLGREGFYQYGNGVITLLSESIRYDVDRINPVRAKQACAAFDPETKEYRCWVALDASRTNNFCFVFSEEGWKRRTKARIQAVCVTKDHRHYMLGAGKVKDAATGDEVDGVWVLDRQVGNFTSSPTDYIIETGWITWTASKDRRSVRTVYLAFRESQHASATISVFRDWRQGSTPTYTDSTNVLLYPPDDEPAYWDEAVWDSSAAPNEWVKRRPYWKKVDVDIPSCEVYKIRIETTHPIEFIGMVVDEEPKKGGFGSRIP